jgi:hypothetical protein
MPPDDEQISAPKHVINSKQIVHLFGPIIPIKLCPLSQNSSPFSSHQKTQQATRTDIDKSVRRS